MKKIAALSLAFVLFCSHDMFLKLDEYYLPANSAATIQLFNGTFELSENSIDRDRMIDVSIAAGGERVSVDTSQWTARNETTYLSFDTGEPGTYVAGVSTRARNIEMKAEAFNNYLEHDGVVDMINERKANGTDGDDAIERYSKHVKTIFQVGERRSDDWQVDFGYPIEFIPLSNPYDLHAGGALSVRLLRDGQPLTDELVYVGVKPKKGHAEGDHTHGEEAGHTHGAATHEHSDGGGGDHDHQAGTQQLRTDANGEVSVPITTDGIWYLRTIHLVTTDEPGLTHESNWATLTFQVDHDRPHGHAGAASHSHGDESHTHGEAGDHGAHIPGYVYILGSFLLVGALFFYFQQRGRDAE